MVLLTCCGWLKRFSFGDEGEIVKKHSEMGDMNPRELATIAPLIVLVFWMGLYPTFFLKYSEKSIEHLVQNKEEYRIPLQSSKEMKRPTIGDRREF